jgi:hypothetical protein
MDIKFNGHKLTMYDNIQELPVKRFQSYNLNTMIDAGIGSDIEAFDNKCVTIRRLMRTDHAAADRELVNMQTTLRMIMSSTSPKMRSFVVLIKSIDGRKLDDEDMTEDGINAIIKELGEKRLTIDRVKDFLSFIKKKIDSEFDVFFPKLNDNARLKEYYANLKRRTLLVLQSIKGAGGDIESQIATIDDFIMSQIKPKNYHGANGLEAKMIANFEETCVILSQNHVSSNPREMTTLSYYQALEVLRAQMKERGRKK